MGIFTNIIEKMQFRVQPVESDVWTTEIVGQPLLVREIRLPEPSTLVAHSGQNAPQKPMRKPSLVIGLHGYGIDEMQMKTLVNIELEQPFVYLAPRAPYIHPTGGYAWFPIDTTGGEFHVGRNPVQSSLALIAGLIPQAVERYQADPAQVYVIGYSQGAAMSIAFMLYYPELLTGGAAISGQLLDVAKSFAIQSTNQPKPFFLGYGTKDGFITQMDMFEAIAFMESHGIDVTYKEYPIPHVVSQQQLRDLENWMRQYSS